MPPHDDASRQAQQFEKAAAEAVRRSGASEPDGHDEGARSDADERLVDAISGVLRTLRADTDPQPDEALRRRTGRAVRRALRRNARAEADPRPSIVAALLGALGGPQQMPGFRSGAAPSGAGTRQLSYVADNLALDLRIEPTGSPGIPRVLVLGQINRDGRAVGAQVLFDAGGTAVHEACCDEYGEFEIELEPGVYAIALLLEDLCVELPGEVHLP